MNDYLRLLIYRRVPIAFRSGNGSRRFVHFAFAIVQFASIRAGLVEFALLNDIFEKFAR